MFASHLVISHMWVDNQDWKVLRSHSSHLSVCMLDVFPMNPCCVLMKVYPHWKFTEIHLQSYIYITGSILLPYEEFKWHYHKCSPISINITRLCCPKKACQPPSTVACFSLGAFSTSWVEDRGLLSHKDPPGGLIYSPRQAWNLRGDLSVIDHPFSVVSSPLTWVWDTKSTVREQQGPTVNQRHNTWWLLFCVFLLYARLFVSV